MDIDEDKLLPVLEGMTEDLAVPFLERRGREKLHRQSPVTSRQLEELRDVVNLLNQRERELTAAVDIAKLLAAKSKRHLAALEESKEQTELVTRVLRAHQQEIQILRESLQSAEAKQEKTAQMLSEAEENLEKLSQESAEYSENLRRMQKQRTPKGEELVIAELKETMEEQYQAFDSNRDIGTRRMLERENEKLRSSVISLEREVLSLNEELRKLRSDLSQSAKKATESSRTVRSLESRIRDLEEESKFKELDLSVARKKLEKLTEELSAGSPAPNGDWRKSKTSIKDSMVFAVEEEEEEEIPDALVTLSPRGRSGDKHFVFDCWQPALELCTVISHEIRAIERKDPDSNRKDPSEEYFTLASQAVKLNSPYMDAICTVSTKELYEKAVKHAIPFHKVPSNQWHLWIESQLTNAYLESVYQVTGRKSIGRSRTLKAVSPM